jgi:hypothetical protein
VLLSPHAARVAVGGAGNAMPEFSSSGFLVLWVLNLSFFLFICSASSPSCVLFSPHAARVAVGEAGKLLCLSYLFLRLFFEHFFRLES